MIALCLHQADYRLDKYSTLFLLLCLHQAHHRLDKYLNTRRFSFSAVFCDVAGIAGGRRYGVLVASALPLLFAFAP